jgi:hypothetical protein
MDPIFLIVGPPAVGKSTTSHALAAHFSKSVHIPVDNLRDMVVSGLLLPGPDWSDALVLQISLARQNAVHSALNYHEAGFAVVIDDFWDIEHFSDYRGLMAHPDFHKIVLLPGEDVAHQRHYKRANGSSGTEYIEQGIKFGYEQLNLAAPHLSQDGWVVLYNSDLGVAETVETILKMTGFDKT